MSNISVILADCNPLPIPVTISSYDSFITYSMMTSAILSHNISLSAHPYIQDRLNELSSLISSSVNITAFYDLSSYIVSSIQILTDALLQKIDRPEFSTSGNIATFSLSGNVVDSGLSFTNIPVLDLSGKIQQENMPVEFYCRNINGTQKHLIQIYTNEFGEHTFEIGEPISL